MEQVKRGGDVIILGQTHGPTVEVLREGIALCGPHNVVHTPCPDDAVCRLRTGPMLAFFHLDSANSAERRVEVMLRDANPRVPVIAFGPVTRSSIVFRFAAHGVAAYLEEPFDAQDVAACVNRVASPVGRLVKTAGLEVGIRDLKEAQRVLRLAMCAEALRRSGGSRRAAARVLGVDRRAVQKIAQELSDNALPEVGTPTVSPANARVGALGAPEALLSTLDADPPSRSSAIAPAAVK